MRILLDENLPESLVPALRRLGHSSISTIIRCSLSGLEESN
jgi:hypothetical protein